jgi:hypothetical protein
MPPGGLCKIVEIVEKALENHPRRGSKAEKHFFCKILKNFADKNVFFVEGLQIFG